MFEGIYPVLCLPGETCCILEDTFVSKIAQPSSTNQPTPAYFLSLELENVRCFGPRQKLDFSDGLGRPAQWTVILGENGVGKTTLLQCLVGMEPLIRTVIREGKMYLAKFPRLFAKQFGKNEKKFEQLPRVRSDQMQIRASIFHGTSLRELNRGVSFESNIRYVKEDQKWEVESNAVILQHYEHLISFCCYGYGAARRMRLSAPVSEKEDNIGDWDTLFDEDAALGNAEEWLLKTYLNARVSDSDDLRDRFQKQFDTIVEVLKKILPDIQDIKVPKLKSFDESARVEFQTPYSWVLIQDLGIGHRTMIAWVVDLARRLFERYPNSADPLSEPAVVLVDEIDLHLHPKWQRDIIQFLSERFTNTQFIVTAHSPLIVQAASDVNARIALLEKEGDHVIIRQDFPSIRSWQIDQVLLSELVGLPSTFSPKTEKLLNERMKILTKGRLSKSDHQRIKELEKEIGPLPSGQSRTEIEARELIRRAAERLRQQGA